MKINKLYTVLSIVIALGVIGGAIYRFDFCKVDRKAFAAFKAEVDIYKLEQYRRSVNQRIWDIKRAYPKTYKNQREYLELMEELRMLDMKIKAYYQSKKRG